MAQKLCDLLLQVAQVRRGGFQRLHFPQKMQGSLQANTVSPHLSSTGSVT